MIKTIRQVLGAIVVVCGVALGFYLGLWLLLVSPLMALASLIHLGTLTVSALIITIIKCIFSGSVCSLFIGLGVILGRAIMG